MVTPIVKISQKWIWLVLPKPMQHNKKSLKLWDKLSKAEKLF